MKSSYIENASHRALIKFAYSFNHQFNVTFIIKSSLTTASTYLQSDLFKKSFKNTSKFKFIINYKYQGKPQAGVLFLSKFMKTKLSIQLTSENVAMFVDNVPEKSDSLLSNGLS